MKRGEVWLCTLDPTVGHEIQKTRSCLIVSPDELNSRLPTIVVTPLAGGSRPTRYRIAVRFRGKDGLILPDHIRTLDRRRALKRLGTIEGATLSNVLSVLGQMFSE
jgi:mRNA interferase MazF